MDSITASESEVKGVHRYTIVINEEEELVKNIIKQLEKQVDVLKACYHPNHALLYQETALYKLPIHVWATGSEAEKIVRKHNARVLAVEPEITILEKTGHQDETTVLFNELKPYGLLEFVRSGRIAITTSTKAFKEYMAEVEQAAENNQQ